MTDDAENLKNTAGPENIKPPAPVAEWIGDCETGFLRLLDQTLLPEKTIYVDCKDSTTVWEAIRRLAVRGAPAIGVAAAYGMVLAAQGACENDFLAELTSAGQYLVSSRPTAVNLEWAVNRAITGEIGRAHV